MRVAGASRRPDACREKGSRAVILDALIAKDGTVLVLSTLSGNPLLIESVEMRTQVQVNFILEH